MVEIVILVNFFSCCVAKLITIFYVGYDYQHNMGLLILEKNELSSKYEEVKASVEEADLAHRRDQSAYVSALAEAKKREESLKKDVGIANECISSVRELKFESEQKIGCSILLIDFVLFFLSSAGEDVA